MGTKGKFIKTDPIQSLLNSGADAYKNIWYAKITGLTTNLDDLDGDNMMFRADNFALPKFSTEGDERQLWGKKIKTPKPEVNMDRTFTITFRMDAWYNLYDIFKNQLHRVVNGQNSASNDKAGISNWITGSLGVEVYGLKGEYAATSALTKDTFTKAGNSEVWKFSNCWVADVSEPQFSRDDASVITFDVKFNFAKSDYKEHIES